MVPKRAPFLDCEWLHRDDLQGWLADLLPKAKADRLRFRPNPFERVWQHPITLRVVRQAIEVPHLALRASRHERLQGGAVPASCARSRPAPGRRLGRQYE